MRWLPFVVLYILQIALSAPAFFGTCASLDPLNITVYFLHHLSDIFLFWGALLVTTPTEIMIHLAFIAGILIHWLMFGNRCIVSVWQNRRCGYDDNKWLDSLLNRSGLREKSEFYQFMWLGLATVYNLVRLWI
jgi:hypothetical protein